MIQVPTYEEFLALQKTVIELQSEVRYLRGKQLQWMTIEQTSEALRVSKMTLHRLTKMGKLQPRYQGRKPLYEAAQISDYIQSTRVTAEFADSRVLSVLQKGKKA